MQRALAVLFAMTLVAAPHAAQQDEKISKDLVTLLFSGFGYPGSDAVSIHEGLPPDFRDDLLPDGAIARVSMTSPRSTTVVAEAAAFTLGDRPRYERKLAAAGWKLGEGPAGNRGLMTSSTPAPSMFCSGDRVLSYTIQSRAGGGYWLRLSVMSMQRYSPCSRDARETSRPRSIFDDLDLPPLPPPPGSRAVGMSGGGGTGSQTQQTWLETTLSAADVEKYYTSLLAEHGWKLQSRVAGDGVSMARFALTTDKMPGSVATLEALSLPAGDVSVTLRVIGPRDDRWRP